MTGAYYSSLVLLSFAVCHLRDSARHLKAVFKLEDMEGHIKNVLDRGRQLDHAANLCERYFNLESRGRIAVLHEIAQTSYDTLELLRGQRSLLLDIHQELVLSKLRIAKTVAFDHFDRSSEPECHPETRVALMQDMMRWVWNPEGDTIFWLQGMAGTGKSTLSRTFAHNLQKKGLLGASFFFTRGDGDRGMARMFFPTIASQLAMQLPALARSLRSALEREPGIGEKSMEMQFQTLVFQPLQSVSVDCQRLTTFVIIIDALNECDPESDATTIIRLLPRLKQLPSVQLKFFVTSRPEFPILLEFDKIRGTYEELVLHHVEEGTMAHDLKAYFESELGRIRDDYNRLQSKDDQLPSDWPGQDRIKLLVRLAVPLFIFAKTVCLFIADYTYSDPEEQLQSVLEVQKIDHASQLHRTYLFVLNRLFLENSGVGLVECDADKKEEILDKFRKIVGSLICLAYPLSIDLLAGLLKLPKKNVRNMLNVLLSVLDIPKSDEPIAPVKILHLSFRDFLMDTKNNAKNPFWVDAKKAHALLAASCMNLLLEDGVIYEDMHMVPTYRPGGPHYYQLTAETCSVPTDMISKFVNTEKVPVIGPELLKERIYYQKIYETRLPPYLQYACMEWYNHFEASEPNCYTKLQRIEVFEKKFTAWVDALTCIGHGQIKRGLDYVMHTLGDREVWPVESKEKSLNRSMRRIGLLMRRSSELSQDESRRIGLFREATSKFEAA